MNLLLYKNNFAYNLNHFNQNNFRFYWVTIEKKLQQNVKIQKIFIVFRAYIKVKSK